ncbi:hypothetical protein [Streptomyces sp. NPDC048565]|uniref:hypothetical protein n=1 Tax=Streptomyces sp. NPDC048565 TaxID=3155266 RepID=UPI003424EA37
MPAWLKEAAAQHKASPAQQQEVPRVLTDEELDSCEEPEAVMQSWLDAVKEHRGSFYDQVEYAVIRSRHRTDPLVRQVRAHIVLSHYEQPVAADALVRLCGCAETTPLAGALWPKRWARSRRTGSMKPSGSSSTA